jgi:hypothetical protein
MYTAKLNTSLHNNWGVTNVPFEGRKVRDVYPYEFYSILPFHEFDNLSTENRMCGDFML